MVTVAGCLAAAALSTVVAAPAPPPPSREPPPPGSPPPSPSPARGEASAASALSGRGAERRDLAVLGQMAQRGLLQVAHALRRHAEPAPRLAQRHRLRAVDAVAQPQHLALVLRELLDGTAQALLGQRDLDLLLGRRAVGG